MPTIRLDLLTPLTCDFEEMRLHISHPWHDEETDRDVVTDGRALLTWNGHQFSGRPVEGSKDPPKVSEVMGVAQPIGTTTLGELVRWCDAHMCPECGTPLVSRCSQCGERYTRRRPGLFVVDVLDRELLSRYLLAVESFSRHGTPVKVCTGGGKDSAAIQLIADDWAIVIMPMDAAKVTVEGPAFVLDGPVAGEEALQ